MKCYLLFFLTFILSNHFFCQTDTYASPPKGKEIVIFNIKDSFGLPIRDAEVSYKIAVGNYIYTNTKLTLENGQVIDTIPKSAPVFDSEVLIKKGGYCEFKKSRSLYGSNRIKEMDFIIDRILYDLEFQLDFANIDLDPIIGAEVKIELDYDNNFVERFNFVTDDFGTMISKINLQKDHIEDPCNKLIKFNMAVTKDGYHSFEKEFKGYKLGSKITNNFTLTSQNDYFTKSFLNNSKSANLRLRISEFIDYLALKSILSDCILSKRSVTLSDFKSKKTLTFKFESMNVYNTIRLSKYDIGKILFDEVIRKVLEPLNIYLFDNKGFSSFDLIVIGKTKDFSNERSEKDIEYRFIIPKDIVTKYKNKDISGQSVLDKSIILMDDERIELKLQ